MSVMDFEACTRVHTVFQPDAKNLPTFMVQRSMGYHGASRKSERRPAAFGPLFLPLTCKRTYGPFHAQLFCGKFSPKGNIFMSAGQDHVIRLFDSSRSKFRLLKSIEAHQVGYSIIDTDYSPDQVFVAYSSWNNNVTLCSVFGDVSHQLQFTDESRSFCAFSLQFSPASDELIAGANDACIYIYDLNRNCVAQRLEAHSNDVNTVTYVDASPFVFCSGSDDHLIKVWDKRVTNLYCGYLSGHGAGLTSVRSKGDGRFLMSNSKDQTLKLWDIRHLGTGAQPNLHSDWDYRIPFFRRMVHTRRNVIVNDMSLKTFQGHQIYRTLIRCDFSPSFSTGGRYAVTGSVDGLVHIYDLITDDRYTAIGRHESLVRQVSWHPSRPMIISTSWDGYLGQHEYVRQSKPDSTTQPNPSAAPTVDDSESDDDEVGIPMFQTFGLRRQRSGATIHQIAANFS
eukprot:c7976_g1_i1.p1 GENE.c7976_g1_i1~~c7976_g1_i1.p1  ORF type:complete len:452 (+),score=56.43 c7976_g1_i1:52-1407(+)